MYLAACAMSSCQTTYEANLTRRQFVVFLSSMIAREKDRGVVILLVDNATQHEAQCLTKHLRDGLQKKKSYQIQKKFKIK